MHSSLHPLNVPIIQSATKKVRRMLLGIVTTLIVTTLVGEGGGGEDSGSEGGGLWMVRNGCRLTPFCLGTV